MAIFKGRVRVRYGYSRWGYTRNNGKGWHGGSDEEGLDSTTIRMADYKGKSISGRVITARKVDRSTGSKTWEWGWYVCVELDAGQTPDAVNCLYFCHNARNLVSVGQRVKSGDALAVMGSTGNASLASPPFAHCHFEVRATAAGAGLDPTAYTGHPNAVGTYGEAIGETEESDMKFLEVTSGKCEVFTAPDVNAVDKHYNGGNDSTANHYAALLAQVQAAQDAAARRAEELARQKQQAAQAAYDKNMGYLNEAYANRNNLLQQNYNDALAQLQASYDSGARGVNRNADSAQQQAYINYMMSKRDLPQALAAQGLTGGMSESALAGMYNSYGNNRNTIDRGRNESLAALLDTLNSNRSSALQSYNSQLSAAEQQKMAYQMQLEQALANGSAEILQNKYDTLQNLDNAYAQQILALQQAAAQAAQKRW